MKRGQVAIVTGAAQGIGLALARQLVKQELRVALFDLQAEKLEAVAEELRQAGGEVRTAVLDVREPERVRDEVDLVAQAHGQLDYIFNNAGIAIAGRVASTTLDDWNRLIDVNIRGVVHGVQAAYPIMQRQGHGHIVNVASVAGLMPCPSLVAYSATKHAVVGLSYGLRAEAAQHGVKVTAVCPGFIDTDLVHHSELRGMDRARAMSGLPKLTTPEACAAAALRGVRKNMAVVVVTGHGKLLSGLQRLSPDLMQTFANWAYRRQVGD
jgi:short-subunit dehydrogenase